MKKFFKSLILFATLILVACTSTDSIITKYEQACKDGDAQKAAELAEKLRGKDLSPEQALRFTQASFVLGQKVAGTIVDEAVSSTLDGILEQSEDATAVAVDKMLDEYEAYLNQYEKLINKAKAGKDVEDEADALTDKIEELDNKLLKLPLSGAQEKRYDMLDNRYDKLEDIEIDIELDDDDDW